MISLTVASEELANRVIMVELDSDVAAVWQTILNGHGDYLARRVAGFRFASETVAQELAKETRNVETRAFQTLLRNRVNRGGILAPGAGLINRGENDKGLGSRWYPATLQRRIHEVVKVKDKIDFIEGDGIETLKRYSQWTSAVFFIDPPYFAANKNRLYARSTIDHEELFRAAGKLRGDFLMTYDVADEARKLAHKYGFDTEVIPMKNTHHMRREGAADQPGSKVAPGNTVGIGSQTWNPVPVVQEARRGTSQNTERRLKSHGRPCAPNTLHGTGRRESRSTGHDI